MSKNELLQEQIQTIQKMLKKPENRLCADCKRPSPSWASINLGVFVCINCSGCHREIGVHVTKIKSINLDLWDKKILKYFKKINNKIANKYWEYHLKNFDFKKIQKDNYLCQDFIRDKYERKKWINKKKKDPMSLIIAGKFKGDSSDEDEENEENDDDDDNNDSDDNNKNKNKNKNKNNKNKNKNKQDDDEDEEEDDNENNENEDDDDDDFEEVEENNNNNNNNKNRPNLGLQIDLFDMSSSGAMSQRAPLSKNLFNTLPNNNNNNLLDINNAETRQDQISKDLLNNIQQAYQVPNSSNNNNTFNNNIFSNNQSNNNFGMLNNNLNMNNMNMNNMNMNNNMFGYNNNLNMNNMNMNNMNMMNMNNRFNNNFGNQFGNNGFNNNMNMMNNNRNNMNNNFNKPQNLQINTQPSFNMEYFQKELNQSKTTKNTSGFTLDLGTTSTRKIKDPFSNLVKFN